MVNVSSKENFENILQQALDIKNKEKSNEIYNRYTSIFSLEISQIYEFLANESTNEKETNLITSKINIFDLPSANILLENKSQYKTENFKSLFAFQNLIAELLKSNLTFNIDPDMYKFSSLTMLLKEFLGKNSICMGLFALKNDTDFKLNELIFKLMKLSKKVLSYPLTNDKNTNAIIRSFRNEINFLMTENNKFIEKMRNNKSDLNNINNHEFHMKQKSDKFKKEISENSLNSQMGNLNPNTGAMDGSISNEVKLENRIKLQQKEIQKLNYELKLAEEEKMKILNNFKKTFNNNNNDSNKNRNRKNPEEIDDDLNDQMEIMSTLNKLQEKLNVMEKQKKQFEEDNLNLTSALNVKIFELEKIKGKNYNLVNNLNSEILNLKNMLNSNKAEMELMRNTKENTVRVKESIVKDSYQKDQIFNEKISDLQKEAEQKVFKASENQMKNFDVERREMKMKTDNLIDEVNELKTSNNELLLKIKKLEFMFKEIKDNFTELMKKYNKETEKFNITDIGSGNLDESRTNSPTKISSKPTPYKGYGVGLSATSKPSIQLINYKNKEEENQNEKPKNLFEQRNQFFNALQIHEKDLEKSLNLEKSKNKLLMEKIKNLRLLSRKLKNLALDYYPYRLIPKENEREDEKTKSLKNLLIEENLDDLLDTNEETSLNKFYEFEISQLRERVKTLEEEKMNSTNKRSNFDFTENFNLDKNPKRGNLQNSNDKEMQMKIMFEIEKLKGKSKNFYNANESANVKEIEKLKFEVKVLKNDLMKMKRNLTGQSYHNDNGDNYNVTNGANVNEIKTRNIELEKMLRKIQNKKEYLDEYVLKLEKENVELKIRVNVAEEQLYGLQDFMKSGQNKY